jgi:hypothetical protein
VCWRFDDENVGTVREAPQLVRQPQAVMLEALSLVVAMTGAGLMESPPV